MTITRDMAALHRSFVQGAVATARAEGATEAELRKVVRLASALYVGRLLRPALMGATVG